METMKLFKAFKLRQAFALAVFSSILVPAIAEERYATNLEWQLTDESVAHGSLSIAEMEKRLEALNMHGVPAWRYHFAKATSWLDFARREHHENDATNITHSALIESHHLVSLMEKQTSYDLTALPMETNVPADSQRIREDLWAKAAAWKQHAGFECAEPEIAEFEVRLVHAGHEYQELGWRHAMSEVQAAERIARVIPSKLDSCQATPTQVCEVPGIVQLPRFVYFGIDRNDLNADSRLKLDQAITVLKQRPEIKLRLEGHTDKLASGAYNQALSARRAHAVRAYLVLGGIDAWRISVSAYGEKKTRTQGCSAVDLALNRRVELVYQDAANVTLSESELGLEVEPAPQEKCEAEIAVD